LRRGRDCGDEKARERQEPEATSRELRHERVSPQMDCSEKIGWERWSAEDYSAGWRVSAARRVPNWEEFGATPHVFVRVANKGVTRTGVCKTGKQRT
jgi:hypothetical protein